MKSETYKTLYIDALTYRKGKAYGYNEYLFNLLSYFYKHREDIRYQKVFIVCESSQKGDFLIFSDKIEIIDFHFANIIQRIWVQGMWNFLIPIHKNDVILSTSNYSTFFKRCKQVLVIHDLLYLHGDLLKLKHIKFQRKLMVPRSISLADKIIAISDYTKDDVYSHFSNSIRDIQTVYNYFNFQKYGIVDSFEPKRRRFISVASPAHHKNTITLLRAFMNYKIKGGVCSLVIIGSLGEGTKEEQLYNQIQHQFPNSIFCKRGLSNAQLASEYSHSSVYVSASLFEGLGMPIVEAMYFGLSLILPNAPSIFREISNGQAAYFNSCDYEELSSIFIQNDLHNIKYGKEYDLERFNERNTSGRYVSILNEI